MDRMLKIQEKIKKSENIRMILIFLVSVIVLFGGFRLYKWNKERIKMNKIIEVFENNIPGQNFYFLDGLKYSSALFSGIKYRGVLYSNKLKELGYQGGMYMELTEKSKGVGYIESYKVLLKAIKVNRLAEEKAREVFGPLTTLTNEFSIGKSVDNILKNYGKTVPYEERAGAERTIVNAYISDFDEADTEKYFKKVYDLGKKLIDEMNYETVLLVYLKPESSLESVDFLNRTMLSIALEDKEVKDVVDKVEEGLGLNKIEKEIIVKNISKNEKVNSEYYMYSLWSVGDENKNFDIEFVELNSKGGLGWREALYLNYKGEEI